MDPGRETERRKQAPARWRRRRERTKNHMTQETEEPKQLCERVTDVSERKTMDVKWQNIFFVPLRCFPPAPRPPRPRAAPHLPAHRTGRKKFSTILLRTGNSEDEVGRRAGGGDRVRPLAPNPGAVLPARRPPDRRGDPALPGVATGNPGPWTESETLHVPKRSQTKLTGY